MKITFLRCRDRYAGTQNTLHEQWMEVVGRSVSQEDFLNENYRYLDGGARKRVFELIFN